MVIASQATGLSKAKNLLMSEDVLSAIKYLKKLGVKIRYSNTDCAVYGRGINGLNLKILY